MKYLKLFLLVIMFAATILYIQSCGKKNAVGPKEPKDDFESFKKQAQLYQDWIERMDPYVVQNPDNTYTLNWDGFISSIKESHPSVMQSLQGNGQMTDDATVVKELKESVQLANILIQTGKFEKALGGACWYYWWGNKCCYWGTEGFVIKTMIQGGALIPWPFNIIFFGLGGYADYIWYKYQRICLNKTWVGGFWINS